MADSPTQPSKRERPAITCPRCGLTSYHWRDVAERYCVRCHAWHDDMGKGDG
jgi:ribosomal protein L37E